MNEAVFRRLALSLPEAIEAAHMGHPDFRVRGKIFATLSPKDGRGVVMLTPEQQEAFVAAEPGVYEAVKGAWGRRGCTYVDLRAARTNSVQTALAAAWRKTAPASLVAGNVATAADGRTRRRRAEPPGIRSRSRSRQRPRH